VKSVRVAVFVDAGYLIARGAETLIGPGAERRDVVLNVRKVVEALVGFAEAKAACPGELLRVYWYDAAGSQPTAEQIRLAESDNVKLRLGIINSLGKQKGVDSLIIADMIELARNSAIGSVVLVGGDEDLRVGVQVAQSYGVRVHLLGIAIDGDKAQSSGLVREGDTNSGWTATDVTSFLSVRAAARAVVVSTVVPARPGVAADIAVDAIATQGAATPHVSVAEHVFRQAVRNTTTRSSRPISTTSEPSGPPTAAFLNRMMGVCSPAPARA
jgi:hypothetical protein